MRVGYYYKGPKGMHQATSQQQANSCPYVKINVYVCVYVCMYIQLKWMAIIITTQIYLILLNWLKSEQLMYVCVTKY